MARKSRTPSPERLEQAAIRDQLRAFRKKFGREPGPEDPLFFDPDGPDDIPRMIDEKKLRDDTLAAMTSAGIAPEIAFAYAKTGYIITERNLDRFTPEALAEWDAAIDEYHRASEGKPS